MKVNKNISIIKLIIILIVTAILLVGGTFALIMITITNGNFAYKTTCFDVTYDAGKDITGLLIPSSTYIGGLNGNVTIGIDQSCNVSTTGNLYLNVDSNNEGNSKLIKTVDSHCEDSNTLKTLSNYKEPESCVSQNNGIWVENGTALKYAVYDEINKTLVSVGYVDKMGESKNIYEISELTSSTQYKVHIWLDGELVDNSYTDLSFSGNISADVIQLPSNAYSDHTLMITSYSCNNTSLGDKPYFTYTGDCEVIDDEDGNWRIRFLTSGEFTSTLNIPIDVFLVGGGGGFSGGGGFTTNSVVAIKKDEPYVITIGNGGTLSNYGESTTGFGSIAYGGSPGDSNIGGSGGSGGGGYGGNGGSDGLGGGGSGGTGQGSTTREFGESDGALYSGGGAGQNGVGGDGGGGNPWNVGTPNSGGGGGYSSNGGSGIIVIRNVRDTSFISQLPGIGFDFTYTGSYAVIDDDDGDWRIKFLTSGEFKSSSDTIIDVFLVGGGGGFSGGGGFTTNSVVTIKKEESYVIEIGNGGAPSNYGGNTAGFGEIAYGGSPGDFNIGGSGGSGGGGYGGNGGSDGSGGGGSGGTGQGSTTREFGESDGALYSGGGAGQNGIGGAGGGGNQWTDGIPNSGGGGGYYKTGGSGIVIIRNAR